MAPRASSQQLHWGDLPLAIMLEEGAVGPARMTPEAAFVEFTMGSVLKGGEQIGHDESAAIAGLHAWGLALEPTQGLVDWASRRGKMTLAPRIASFMMNFALPEYAADGGLGGRDVALGQTQVKYMVGATEGTPEEQAQAIKHNFNGIVCRSD